MSLSAHLSDEPLALSGLNALLATAVQNSPDHILVEDDAGPSTAAQFAGRVERLAFQLRSSALARGERVLIVAGAQTDALVATVAALRASLEPVLTPCLANPVDLATRAQVAGAAALIGPSRYGDLDLGDVYLSAAALAESVRGVLTHGPEPVDGAVDISFAKLDVMPDRVEPVGFAIAEMPTIATFVGPSASPQLVSHRQAALFADALSLVEQARINPSRRIVSLLPPASVAGLVGGPFAAFVGASRLVLHGPFEGARFLAHCDAAQGDAARAFHLVAPAAIGRFLAPPILTADLASLIVVSRFPDRESFVAPAKLECAHPVIDLYSFGEEGVLAQPRQNGEAAPLVRAADLSLADGLGARLNRARAEHRIHGLEGQR